MKLCGGEPVWVTMSSSRARPWLPALVFVEIGSIHPGGFASGFLDRVVVDGDTIAVSAPVMDVDGATDRGAIFVYERDPAGEWNEVAQLLASDGVALDELGRTLALAGDVLVAAAPSAERNGQVQRGAVYVYVRDVAGAWNEVQTLVPADADDWDHLGSGLAIDDEGRILVGASGAAPAGVDPPGFLASEGAVYVFEPQPDATWAEGQKFYASDTQTGWGFGSELAIDGDTLAVAAANANGNGAMYTGAIYVYTRDPTGTFVDENKLGAGSSQGSAFGASLSVSGDHLVVGAPQQSVGNGNAGSAFVFTRDAVATWGAAQQLIEPSFEAGNEFGAAVAVGEGTVIVGAGASGDGAPGAGYVYHADPAGSFVQVQELGSGADPDYFYGRALSFDGTTLAVRSLIDGGTIWIYESEEGPTLCLSDADCKSGVCEAGGTCCASDCDVGDTGSETGSDDGEGETGADSATSGEGTSSGGAGAVDEGGMADSTTGGDPPPPVTSSTGEDDGGPIATSDDGGPMSGSDEGEGTGGTAADAPADADGSGGCACRAAPGDVPPAALFLPGLGLLALRRRRG